MITIFTGPMFSGKTTALIKAYNDNIGDKIAIKPLLDSREVDDFIHSHDGGTIPAIRSNLGDWLPENVFIDEAQFLPTRDVEYCIWDRKRHYWMSMLNLDFRLVQFPAFSMLKSISNHIFTFQSRCSVCGQPADFSYRKSDSTDLVVCGGGELYEPRCVGHFPVLCMSESISEHSPSRSP